MKPILRGLPISTRTRYFSRYGILPSFKRETRRKSTTSNVPLLEKPPTLGLRGAKLQHQIWRGGFPLSRRTLTSEVDCPKNKSLPLFLLPKMVPKSNKSRNLSSNKSQNLVNHRLLGARTTACWRQPSLLVLVRPVSLGSAPPSLPPAPCIPKQLKQRQAQHKKT